MESKSGARTGNSRRGSCLDSRDGLIINRLTMRVNMQSALNLGTLDLLAL